MKEKYILIILTILILQGCKTVPTKDFNEVDNGLIVPLYLYPKYGGREGSYL